MVKGKLNCLILLIGLIVTDASQAQFTWDVSIGANYSQNLVDRKGNPTGAIDDDFHPSVGGQINSNVGYRFGSLTVGTGVGLVFMNFFADKNSVFTDWFPGEERTDTRWSQWLVEIPINVEYDLGGNLPTIEAKVLNALNYQHPFNTFGLDDLPYTLGVGLGIKHYFSEHMFGRLLYRYYGLENSWKPEKGTYFYPSIWSLDMGYQF
jgi:opacity protein-like surface antigen